MCYINPTAFPHKNQETWENFLMDGRHLNGLFHGGKLTSNKTFSKLSVIRGDKRFLGGIRTRGNKWSQKF